MSVSALLIRMLVEALERAGVSPEALLAPSNIDRSRLDRVDERFEFAEFALLQERAATLLRDPALGLHMASRTSESAFDSIGFLVGHASTLREAISVATRFGALVLDGTHLVLRDSVDLTTIHFAFPRTTTVSDRMLAEFTMAGLLRVARQLAGAAVLPRSVSFEHPRPPYHQEYTRLFGGSERFAQTSTFIAFQREILDRPQLHQSPELFSIVCAEVERKLRSITGNLGPTERLRRYLLAHPMAHMPDMARAARDLGMSERSLRRQLASENASYRELVRAALEDGAGRMLRDPTRTIQETAIALGFVDARTFHRAFKTWTGMTPKQYRDAHGAG
jgi:AraC-like DNA-binding protein